MLAVVKWDPYINTYSRKSCFFPPYQAEYEIDQDEINVGNHTLMLLKLPYVKNISYKRNLRQQKISVCPRHERELET